MSFSTSYWNELADQTGSAWNRFWFTPQAGDERTVAKLRIIVGLMALYYHLSFFPDLVRWFGPDGLLPIETTQRLLGEGASHAHPSLLWLAESVPSLLLIHAGGWLVLLAFTLGFRTALTKWLAAVVILSYVHRAPMIGGPMEPVLTMLLCYLCLTRCGQHYSWDARANRQLANEMPKTVQTRWGTHLGLRLIQVHLAGFYLVMATNKLAGPPWWNGDAMWWLIAHTETRLVDLTFLHRYPSLVDTWTHSVVLFELAFPVLIWVRIARPLMALLGLVHWGLLSLVTGNVALAVLMVGSSIAFLKSGE